MMPDFTEDWFSHNIPSWEQALAEFKGKPIDVIEIGSFEGRATVWLLDNILTHKLAGIVCVDTWEGSAEHANLDMKAVKRRFDSNVKGYGAKVTTYQGKSTDFFLDYPDMEADIIYIDGNHTAAAVLTDAVLAHQALRPGGMMIFDDYLWQQLIHSPDSPRAAIDAFMECFAKEYDMVAVGYQVILRRKKDGGN